MRGDGIREIPDVVNHTGWFAFVKPQAAGELIDSWERLLQYARQAATIPVQVLPEVQITEAEFNAISVLWPDSGKCIPRFDFRIFVGTVLLLIG
jgi:hypothetical protein